MEKGESIGNWPVLIGFAKRMDRMLHLGILGVNYSDGTHHIILTQMVPIPHHA